MTYFHRFFSGVGALSANEPEMARETFHLCSETVGNVTIRRSHHPMPPNLDICLHYLLVGLREANLEGCKIIPDPVYERMVVRTYSRMLENILHHHHHHHHHEGGGYEGY